MRAPSLFDEYRTSPDSRPALEEASLLEPLVHLNSNNNNNNNSTFVERHSAVASEALAEQVSWLYEILNK